MTREEAAAIVRLKWDDNDGCRSCGWKSALYEIEPVEQFIDERDIENGYVDISCLGDDSEDCDHRGARVYLTRADASATNGEASR